MKCRFLISTVFSAVFILSGCQPEEFSQQLIPDGSQVVLGMENHNEVFQSHDLLGPATITVPLSVLDPGIVEIENGVTQITNQVLEGPVSGDMVGSTLTVFNGRIHQETGMGIGYGTFDFQITTVRDRSVTGSWQGRYKGRIDGIFFSGKFEAQGTGQLSGFIYLGTFSEPEDGIFELTGKIRRSHYLYSK